MKWISISEKLPEPNKEVLLYSPKWIVHHLEYLGHHLSGIRMGYIDQDKVWTSSWLVDFSSGYNHKTSLEPLKDDKYYTDDWKDEIPTHWMEMPEAPSKNNI